MAATNSEKDTLVNKIDEILCLKTLEELRKIATKVGGTCELTNKNKPQVRGFITKFYMGAIKYLGQSETGKAKPLPKIIEAINNESAESLHQKKI